MNLKFIADAKMILKENDGIQEGLRAKFKLKVL